MKLRCIIVDDELPAIQQVRDYIQRVPFLELVAEFDNALEPIDFLRSNHIDVIFLDIEMEGFTGIQFVKSMKEKPYIVLTTAYDQYAIQAFDLNVSDYLLKPISFERFVQSVDKVYSAHARELGAKGIAVEAREYMFVKTEYRLQRIDFSDLLYVEGMREYLRFHTLNERIMSLMSFASVLDQLPPERFVRVHKSFVVAIDKIHHIERQRIYIGDAVIPLSNSFKDDFFQRLA